MEGLNWILSGHKKLMSNPTRTVRTSAKALIQQDSHVLLIRHKEPDGFWRALPGGGQENGEDLHSALIRECKEEIGATIKVGRLLFVRDYIADNHEFAHENPGFHQVEFIFECSLTGEYHAKVGTNPDAKQVGVDWVSTSSLANSELYPKVFRQLIPQLEDTIIPSYLGDVN